MRRYSRDRFFGRHDIVEMALVLLATARARTSTMNSARSCKKQSWHAMKMGVSAPDESRSSTSSHVFMHLWQGWTDAVCAGVGRQDDLSP